MKTILTLIIALFSTFAVNAQTYTLDQLVGTTWRMIAPHEKNLFFTWEFTTNEVKLNFKTIYFSGRISRSNCSKPYYLSNVLPKTFDKSKVGKVKQGSFLIIDGSNSCLTLMESYKILYIKEDSMRLYHKPVVEYGEAFDHYIDFVRMK